MSKKCDTCGNQFKGFGTTCKVCRSGGKPQFQCPNCNTIFTSNNAVCDACGRAANQISGPKVDHLDDPLILKQCAACGKPFPPNDVGENWNGKRYHHACLKCERCGKYLGGTATFRGTEMLCQSCGMSDVCAACGKSISGSVTTVGGKKYHPDCFCCVDCKKPIKGPHSKRDGQPVCTTCASGGAKGGASGRASGGAKGGAKGGGGGAAPASGDLCKKCGKLVTGAVFRTPQGDKFHKDCFFCAHPGCKTGLQAGYFLKNNEYVCPAHK